MLLADLCVDIQEQVCSLLSTRDILALSSCCWAQVAQRVLQARETQDTGITLISRWTNNKDKLIYNCEAHARDIHIVVPCTL